MKRDEATTRQVNAADPDLNTWLSANAGSGKTRVLTDRVARLLFNEVEPQNILCLTYTKAAAAEMQNRLFKRLGAWAMLDDDTLRRDLRQLGIDSTITALDLKRARTLFARAIETPGGLKIQTIHSFCASVLRRFPLEAQISPQFKEMEDRTASLLRSEVLDTMIEGDAGPAVVNFLRYYTGAELDKIVAAVAGKRSHFITSFDHAATTKALGLDPTAQRTDALDMAFPPDAADIAENIKSVFAGQTKTYQKFASDLAALNYANPTWDDFAVLTRLFLYADSARSKSVNFPQSNHGKAVEAMAPIADDVHAWMDAVAQAQDQLWAHDALEKTAALYAFGSRFVTAYETRKTEMGMLDFDDLIDKARLLLSDSAVADWVLFRLDGGIDHLLVDEAQDTSPAQWAVIRSLTEQFGSGDGARSDTRRTLFVVGDKKQSIYSFQGADPEEFDRMKDYFDGQLSQVGDSLHPMDLAHSFRSSQAVLRVVDETFAADHITGLGGQPKHIAFKTDMPGRVDMWPVVEPSTSEKEDQPWTNPVDVVSDAHHNVRMAKQVAAEIKRMIACETLPVEDGNTGTFQRRKVTEGDILILVQRRSELFSEIIRACKIEGLKIAGADRLRVGAELAVKDIAALLNFLALPEDDLSLACALRSPLFGWSEQDIYTLAHHRPKGFLWPQLRHSDHHPKTLGILHDLRKQADFMRPYDLIERILTRHDGRRKLLARLGQEAEDGIDALLSQALAYESQGVPSLTGFLAWMQADELEVKRQIDSQSDQIRVMTVHGAKGLEAPIVFLPDTAKRANTVKADFLPAENGLIWKTPSKQSAAAVGELSDNVADAQMRERMRLLYVAMTRAEKWLIVGAAGDVGDSSDSWYNVIAQGMERAGWVDDIVGDMTIKRVGHLDWDQGETIQNPSVQKVKVIKPTFDELPQIKPSKTRAPSDLGGAKVLAGDPAGEDVEAALARGRLMHKLLEHLPTVPPQDRAALGQKITISHPDALDADDYLVADAIGLIASPDLSHVFATDALVEVDVTAALPQDLRIHGAIDRLIVSDTSVLAVDFKTNRLVPNSPDKTPDGLLRQMGAYHAALVQIFPDHRVDTAILWTASGKLMIIPQALVSDALNRVTAP